MTLNGRSRFRIVMLGVSAAATASGCAATAPEKPATQATSAPPPKTRCAPGAASAPDNAKGKMTSMQGDVRRCFTLGTPGKTESTVKVEVTVAESGEVREAHVVGEAGGHDSAVQCMVKAFKGTKFGKFCGDDVSIAWTYALR